MTAICVPVFGASGAPGAYLIKKRISRADGGA
jgi:hypothetical protein